MPFDMSPQDVETVTKPEVWSVRGLVAWLETQNPATEYEWRDCNGGCLIGHYLKAQGFPVRTMYRVFGEDISADYAAVCNGSDRLGGFTGWTYGAALSRARALLAKP